MPTVLLALAGVLLVAGCGTGTARSAEPTAGPVGAAGLAADLAPGRPGTLISQATVQAPAGMLAWKIRYHTRDQNGSDVEATGVVVAPDSGLPVPAGGRRVVTFGHGTTGINDACAPSRADPPLSAVAGTFPLVDDGHVVAVTDYIGLGSPGEHAIYVARPEGQAMLDIARAARQLPAAHAGTDIAIWGYSQGGQAALAAGVLAHAYAPELTVHGVVATAPLADLPGSLAYLAGNADGVAYLLLAVIGLSIADPSIQLDHYLTNTGRRLVSIVREHCVIDLTEASVGQTTRTVFTVDPLTTEPFASGLAAQRDAVLGRMAPALVLQGDLDMVIHQPLTDGVVRGLCARGTVVDYRRYAIADHGTIHSASVRDLVAWIDGRFDPNPPPIRDICAAGQTT